MWLEMRKPHKGIILAGGSGSRLYPITKAVSKQLLPVYNKPMIFFPLSVLMLSQINEILLITTPDDQRQFQRLLGNGNQWGLKISYAIQPSPDGLAQALIIGEEFLDGAPCALVLGDNLFYANELRKILKNAINRPSGATIFACAVSDPERYGVVEISANGNVLGLQEKPSLPQSNLAVTGLYFFDEKASEYAKTLSPSERGELEITDLNRLYLEINSLNCETFGRGVAWFDTGTYESLLEASQFVQTLEHRQGLQVASLEEIAFTNGWISSEELRDYANTLKNADSKNYFLELANNGDWHGN